MPAVLAASQLGHEASWDPRTLGLVPVVPPRISSTASMCGMYDKCWTIYPCYIAYGTFPRICVHARLGVIPAPLGAG